MSGAARAGEGVDLFTGIEEQLRNQRAHATMVVRNGPARLRLELVRIEYVDEAPYVSVIGHAISRGAVDVWRSRGAAVQVLETVTCDCGQCAAWRK